jgi:4-alpha-glucanotransferase
LGGLPFVAEDLGLITPEVEALRDELGLPGMRVLQFAFDGDVTSPHLPHNHVRNSVVYTGTHDNDTAVGWFRALDAKGRRYLRDYLPHVEEDGPWALIRLAWSSVANHAIVRLQDILALGREARMNVPGRAAGNWRWRLRDHQPTADPLARLGELTDTMGRAITDGLRGEGLRKAKMITGNAVPAP